MKFYFGVHSVSFGFWIHALLNANSFLMSLINGVIAALSGFLMYLYSKKC